MTSSIQKQNNRWLAPILLFAIFTPWSAQLDVYLEQLFYTSHTALPRSFSEHAFFNNMFTWGIVPGLAVAWAALPLLLLSYTSSRWLYLRSPCLILILTLLVGGGLITHVLLKDHWGRPRPRQVDIFGGKQPFRPYYRPNFWQQPEPSKSFPCGHCSTGFFFFAVGRLGQKLQKRWLYYAGYTAAWMLGMLLGWTRMAQGGHFLSDVIATALIMWETTLLMQWLCTPSTTSSISCHS